MKLHCLSRKGIISYTNKHKNEAIAVISIASKSYPFPHPDFTDKPQVKDVLNLDFDTEGKQGIQQTDADAIVEFTNRAFREEKLDSFCVHCDGGLSRSAGVVAAISTFYFGSPGIIFSDPEFKPNMKVYEMLLATFNASSKKAKMLERLKSG